MNHIESRQLLEAAIRVTNSTPTVNTHCTVSHCTVLRDLHPNIKGHKLSNTKTLIPMKMRPRADHISPKLVNLLEVRIVLITCKRMKKSGTKIRI